MDSIGDLEADECAKRYAYVEAVKNAADIVSVIGEYTHLAKKGLIYIGFCPWEPPARLGLKTFLVSPLLQHYRCFSCGAVGDSIKFVMDMDGVSYSEALRKLADKFQVNANQVGTAP